jgi:hypothetical protein
MDGFDSGTSRNAWLVLPVGWSDCPSGLRRPARQKGRDVHSGISQGRGQARRDWKVALPNSATLRKDRVKPLRGEQQFIALQPGQEGERA